MNVSQTHQFNFNGNIFGLCNESSYDEKYTMKSNNKYLQIKLLDVSFHFTLFSYRYTDDLFEWLRIER